MDFKAEIDDLKRRVGDLEGAVNVLSGRYGALKPELQTLERRGAEGFDRMGAALDRLVTRMDTMNSQVWSLRDDLPALVERMLAPPSRRDGRNGPGGADGGGHDRG